MQNINKNKRGLAWGNIADFSHFFEQNYEKIDLRGSKWSWGAQNIFLGTLEVVSKIFKFISIFWTIFLCVGGHFRPEKVKIRLKIAKSE